MFGDTERPPVGNGVRTEAHVSAPDAALLHRILHGSAVLQTLQYSEADPHLNVDLLAQRMEEMKLEPMRKPFILFADHGTFAPMDGGT